MRKKAVQQGRSERRGESYFGPYGEPLSDTRTPLAVFFRILLDCREEKPGGRDLFGLDPRVCREKQRMDPNSVGLALQYSLDRNSSYFLPRIASLAALATRNLTTRFAGILISAPV